MKNVIIIYFLAILSLQNSAQIQKGNFILGGNINYYGNSNRFIDTAKSTNNNNKHKDGSLNVNLNCGYFFTDNLAAGVFLGCNSNSNIYESSYHYGIYNSSTRYRTKQLNTTYSFGAFARFYGMKKENKLRTFVQLNGAYELGWLKTKNEQSNAPDKKEVNRTSIGYEASINPGIVYFVTKKIGLEATFGSISYSHHVTTQFSNGLKVNTSTGDVFNTNFSLNTIRFGVYFYFGI
jgi:outer membrane protein W